MANRSDIEVGVYKGRQLIEKIQRPLHVLGQARVVKYKRKFWLLDEKNRIHLDKGPYTVISAVAIEVEEAPQPSDAKNHSEEGSSPVSDGEITWTEAQRNLIESATEERLLVSACPGAGKTAVACARVAWLIDNENIPPSKIIVVSFSRTAVREIRNRIGSYLKNKNFAYAIPIATIDSFAWQVHTGFSEASLSKPMEKMGYEENIQSLINLVQTDEQVQTYLGDLQHILVDEAQDILGVRADLITVIFDQLDENCGVTVLGDEAQAIYGFSGDAGDYEGASDANLMYKLENQPSFGFKMKELKEVHRTSSPQLLKLFTDVRKEVVALDRSDANAPLTIAEKVKEAASGEAIRSQHPQALAGATSTFVLFRRRAEVLQSASFFCANHVAHRLRMTGLPTCVYPWIGAVFGDYDEPNMRESDFMERWPDRCSKSWINCGVVAEEAWKILRQFDAAKKGIVRISQLRRFLGRSQPPVQSCLPDFGLEGPVLGTIHASKGREADRVHLLLPVGLEDQNSKDPAEEARVIFVGGTRAKDDLFVGVGPKIYAKPIGQRRRIVSKRPKPLTGQLQIGCVGDISAQSMVGRDYFNDANEAAVVQQRLREYPMDYPVSLSASSKRDNDYAFELIGSHDGDMRIGWLDKNVFNNDMWEAACYVAGVKRDGPKPPNHFNHIWMYGVMTIALPPDSPVAESLHEPWASSGFLLAPMVSAYTMAYFRRR